MSGWISGLRERLQHVKEDVVVKVQQLAGAAKDQAMRAGDVFDEYAKAALYFSPTFSAKLRSVGNAVGGAVTREIFTRTIATTDWVIADRKVKEKIEGILQFVITDIGQNTVNTAVTFYNALTIGSICGPCFAFIGCFFSPVLLGIGFAVSLSCIPLTIVLNVVLNIFNDLQYFSLCEETLNIQGGGKQFYIIRKNYSYSVPPIERLLPFIKDLSLHVLLSNSDIFWRMVENSFGGSSRPDDKASSIG